MKARRRYLDAELLNRLGPVEVEVSQLVEGVMAGVHKSPFRGHSVEFAQHRAYVPGDETRRIDWKVFGRSDRLVVKEFHEETNFIAYLLVDATESMRFSSGGRLRTKFEYGCTLAAAFAYLVLRQHDAVSLHVFREGLAGQAEMGTQFHFLDTLAAALEAAQPTAVGSAGGALAQAAQRCARRGLVIVVSDLMDDVASVTKGIRLLRALGHEVVVFHVLDPAELDFPYEGNIRFEGLERSGNLRIDARRLREAYLEELDAYLADLRRACGRTGADYRLARTDQELGEVLLAFVRERMRRLGAGR